MTYLLVIYNGVEYLEFSENFCIQFDLNFCTKETETFIELRAGRFLIFQLLTDEGHLQSLGLHSSHTREVSAQN